jgi:hypothetical protein
MLRICWDNWPWQTGWQRSNPVDAVGMGHSASPYLLVCPKCYQEYWQVDLWRRLLKLCGSNVLFFARPQLTKNEAVFTRLKAGGNSPLPSEGAPLSVFHNQTVICQIQQGSSGTCGVERIRHNKRMTFAKLQYAGFAWLA